MTTKLLVYRLLEASLVGQRAILLGDALSAAAGADPSDCWFEPQEGGGFRWQRSAPPAPARASDPIAAKSAAADYMAAVNRSLAKARTAQGLDPKSCPDAFPLSNLRFVSSQLIGPRSDHPAHFLTRWGIVLPPSAEFASQAPVLGATVEVRIAGRSQAWSVVSRIRPWIETIAAESMLPPADGHDADGHQEHAEHGHSTSPRAAGGGQDPPLVYLLDCPGEPQRFLAPCWLVPPDSDEEGEDDHHARRFWPACDYAIFPEIVVGFDQERMILSATILWNGASTALEVLDGWSAIWSVATAEDFLAGRRSIYEGAVISIATHGIHYVTLEVENRISGAVRTTTAQIGGAPKVVTG